MANWYGGRIVSEVLRRHGVRWIFGVSGGHVAPVFVEAKRAGIQVVDTRHEATAAFAADAVSRLTGGVGVAVVTAGPGVTNTVTALKNAQLAESPLLLIGGAAATALQGKGALQDVDQLAVVAPHVKWAAKPARLAEVAPALEEAFRQARSGVPGPVFVELAADLLYPEEVVRDWYGRELGRARSLGARLAAAAVRGHLERLFGGRPDPAGSSQEPSWPHPDGRLLDRAARMLRASERPVLLVGSQAMLQADRVAELRAAVEFLGIPTYLSGMARGLLGAGHPLHCRHERRRALKEADLVLLAGVACDFRLGYGRHIGSRAKLVTVNRDPAKVSWNLVPSLAVVGDPCEFLLELADRLGAGRTAGPALRWRAWLGRLAGYQGEREERIQEMAEAPSEPMNPLALLKRLDGLLEEDSVLVGDGGDFVASASYILRPRGPLRWLDPGVFGTLGVGAGFALAARLVYPRADVWLLYGDGACGYSLAEVDTFARHGLGLVALVGNDRAWTQIQRGQVEILGDPVATELGDARYGEAARGFGGEGFTLERIEEAEEVLRQARDLARQGRPVVVDARIGPTEFRKGSLSM